MNATVYPAVLTRSGASASQGSPMVSMSGAVIAMPKRQRARLWELNESIHCSIIGTCLTTGELRRVMSKVMRQDTAGSSDHDLHSQAVGLCNRHTPAAKLLHKSLDQRHETVIKRFARFRSHPK